MVSLLDTPTFVPIPADVQMLYDMLSDLSEDDRSLILRAYQWAEEGHRDVCRKSGEPYITHPVAVARILAEMKLDAEAIAAALMHDLLEDTTVTYAQIHHEFGPAVAAIIDGVTKLAKLPTKAEIDRRENKLRSTDLELEYIRKMALAMNNDIRVILVKLADRLHNMRTLGFMKPEKQTRIAQETLDIFAPLANRLGIWQFKWELEDLSLRYLNPDAYKAISRSIDEKRDSRNAYMQEIAQTLRDELSQYEMLKDALISSRPKHIYSIYRKMERKQLPFEQIYDVRAVRVVVKTIPECYLVLGVVHNLWRPIPTEFDDYIANPKDNFYRSLHTAVLDQHGKTLEVQIRTREMHEHAEYGVAAHWRYKEGNPRDRDLMFEKRIEHIRRLMEFGDDELDAGSFVETMKSELFQDRIYVYTPKGDVVDLKAGATPIDFAYHIHTDIGNSCRGALVQGRWVPLNYQLQSGDQVEIKTSKRGGPSIDWLNADLGYVRMERTRNKIRNWLRRQNREKNIQNGRDLVEREMNKLSVMATLSFETVAGWFNYDKVDQFFAAIGAGDITSGQIVNRILEAERRAAPAPAFAIPKSRSGASVTVNGAQGVVVTGVAGVFVNLARCCHPVPGDSITGFTTRGRGVVVHRSDCPQVAAVPESDRPRLLAVTWDHTRAEQRYCVPIEIIAHDRAGLLKDITTVVADEKGNINNVSVITSAGIARLNLLLEIPDIAHMGRILARLDTVPSVVDVRRRLTQ
jgi:GTP pyrophosphokinase